VIKSTFLAKNMSKVQEHTLSLTITPGASPSAPIPRTSFKVLPHASSRWVSRHMDSFALASSTAISRKDPERKKLPYCFSALHYYRPLPGVQNESRRTSYT
jgi:hypothetical protein